MSWVSNDGSVIFDSKLYASDEIANLQLRIRNLTTPLSNWIALGVSQSGGMANSDIVLGHFLAGSRVGNMTNTTIGQYWAEGNRTPVRLSRVYFSDASLQLYNRSRSVGDLVLSFNRSFASSGPFSNPLQMEPGKESLFIYATGPMGPRGEPLMHRNVFGQFSVVFTDGDIAEPAPPFNAAERMISLKKIPLLLFIAITVVSFVAGG